MFNFLDAFGKLQQLQDGIKRTREQLDSIVLEGEAGGGMVKVSVNGNRRVLKIQVDPEILKDKEMTEDLVAAATNKALEKAEQTYRELLSKTTSEYLPNIPGLDISKML